MPELNIPKVHQEKFINFIELSDDFKQKLYDSLSSFSDDFNIDDIVEDIKLKIDELSRDKISSAVTLCLNLLEAKDSFEVSLSEFIPYLEKALIKTENPKLSPNSKILSDFEKLLKSGNTIGRKAKIIHLMTENQSIFIKAKIYQDIRTGFDEDKNILGSAIVHNLKITMNKGGNVENLYVSLDDNDLRKLSQEIKDAQEKSKLLNDKFPSAKIINLLNDEE